MKNLAFLRDVSRAPDAFGFWNDFTNLDDLVTITGAYTFTALTSGTLLTDEKNGGWAKITAATTDNRGGQLQTKAIHACTPGKRINFCTRVQLAGSAGASSVNATQSDLIFGLYPTDTSVEAGVVADTDTDGIYFYKVDASTAFKCIVKGGSATRRLDVTATSITQTAGNFAMDLSAHHFGISILPLGATNNLSTIDFFIDGVRVGGGTDIQLPLSSIFLAPTVSAQAGDNAETYTYSFDYIGSYQER
jgi:hypothetical protein